MVVGYATYIRLVAELVAGKDILSTGMTQEVDRVAAAVDAACSGRAVALVSGGDPGIYAMAGLVFEVCAARRLPVAPAGKNAPDGAGLFVEIVPGISAMSAGAALLGAPLMHDFAVISLSDLLTPWGIINHRLESAAVADFVIVIYNPKSKKRDWQLQKAQQILLRHRARETPVGIVTGAMREGQRISITTLGELHGAEVDMQTTVFIGNRTTVKYGDFLYTLRGYGRKYVL